MHPKHLSIEDFVYDLPNEKIALHPAHPRDASKLLICDDGDLSEDTYHNIGQYLPKGSTLVFNDTRVIKSRILFEKASGSTIEIFCLEPHDGVTDYEIEFQRNGTSLWKCMIGKAGKWKEKQLFKTIQIDGEAAMLYAELVEKIPDAYIVRFVWQPSHFTLAEVINAAGVTPLPPYIKRVANEEDEHDYQTVYSTHEGSVAAPTAGLHFTADLLTQLRQNNIKTLFTTLHVGAGTFKPVKSATMEGHSMHAEWMNITVKFLDSLIENLSTPIISVGTTATRTLESIYWMGNKIINNKSINENDLKIKQWEVYEANYTASAMEAILALKEWMIEHEKNPLIIETEIIIAPGYQFQIITGLITNFHQPKSTLLLLVAALAGPGWKKGYEYALAHNFRFLSYGDGCLILPNKKN